MAYQRGKPPQAEPSCPPPNKESIEKIIVKGDVEELNKYANDLGKELKKKLGKEKALSTSQIRSVLDEIQRMGEFNLNRIQLLRYKLVNAAGRHRGRVRQLQGVLEVAIGLTKDKEKFENLRNFFEAIVAYHRYHGGSE